MKLSERYNRVNLIATMVIMLITGAIYYQTISTILTNQKDQSLVVEENEVFDYVKLNHHLPQVFKSQDQQITFTTAPKNSVKREFINTKYYKKNDEAEAGRGLISSILVGDIYYKILIVESKVETEYLIKIIFGITIGVILLLVLVLVVTNRLILSRLWRPFYSILGELKLFNVTDIRQIPELTTSIDEFNELHNEVTAMAERVKHDYKDLKTFTENASHELLTPIAVINSKLDTLIQTENFSDRQSKLLNDLYGAVNRLSRLNQSLLLLVKIENKLLKDNQQIDLYMLIQETLAQFEEIFQDKGIRLSCRLDEKQIYASRYLMEILLNNLISNAIRHNHTDGEVRVSLTTQSLTVQNTGETIALQEEQIFTRFHKSAHSEGSGLGLTISRQICESFNFSLNYSFQAPYHTFTVRF